MRRRFVAVLCGTVVAVAGCSANSQGPSAPVSSGRTSLNVEVVTRGLAHGWDIAFLPDGKVLVPQRGGTLRLISGTKPGATSSDVSADFSSVFAQGEGGLMGLVLHPDFATSREFTTCHNFQSNGEPVDIRLVTWKLSQDDKTATKVKDLLTGLPTAQSGRHSGCRPTIAADGSLIVGTGDTAQANISQDLTSLGGKTLRLNIKTGQPWPDNPFIKSANKNQRFVYTYGHRNVQGVAQRPNSPEVYAVEHGPNKDDEVNLLQPGGNYGWDPSRGGSTDYDESVPMTDTQRFPKAVGAAWSSGSPTVATTAAAFLQGSQWRELNGMLAVTALKGSKLLLMSLGDQGKITSTQIPPELDQKYQRLRAARLGPDGALYVTTSNGHDDALLRITPR